ncbi:DUF1684 domain-containing protein [Ktedonospora formicarum]|uniref:DUF1684 domain-containing protein n=1 Tax=Ktedonospora formicarum TaxID=2778364 RepID=A0A8J3MT54_9CHLR|nr:DUF1684 domain-containing protein [Ktedonospora formicarum]GHO46810.1 hypothetical protein KSX_49730 [Ktedonospora formicarum]
MSTYLELYDYRQQVFALYRERDHAILAGKDSEAIWKRFCMRRDTLFAQHSQSALTEEQRRTFTALPYFPYNPALRFAVEIETNVEPQRQSTAMNSTESMEMATVGRVHFTVEGEEASLDLYWLDVYGGGLFLPFRDTTCPQEAYGGGRYLFDTVKGSTPIPAGEDGKNTIILDFNYAYNPSCAYNDAWVCPLAPMENRLTVPIRAGELKYR